MLTDEEINTLFVQVRDSIADLHDLRSTFARAIEREVLRKAVEEVRRIKTDYASCATEPYVTSKQLEGENAACRGALFRVIDALEGRWKP